MGLSQTKTDKDLDFFKQFEVEEDEDLKFFQSLVPIAPESTALSGISQGTQLTPAVGAGIKPREVDPVAGILGVADTIPFIDEIPGVRERFEKARRIAPGAFKFGQISGTIALGAGALGGAKLALRFTPKVISSIAKRAIPLLTKNKKAQVILARAGVDVVEGAIADGLFNAIQGELPNAKDLAIFAAVDAALPIAFKVVGKVAKKLRPAKEIIPEAKKIIPGAQKQAKVAPEVQKTPPKPVSTGEAIKQGKTSNADVTGNIRQDRVTETIVSAATKTPDGKIFTGTTHGQSTGKSGFPFDDNSLDQGFLTSSGRFVSREEAAKIVGKKVQKLDTADFGIEILNQNDLLIQSQLLKGSSVEKIERGLGFDEKDILRIKKSIDSGTPIKAKFKGSFSAKETKFRETTSARKFDMSKDREVIGLNELNSPERKTFQTSLDNAKAKGFDEKALDLADDVLEKPKAFNDEETAGVVLKSVEIKNTHEDLHRQLKKAVEGSDVEKTLLADIERAEEKFDKLSEALRVSGTEKGRALVSQKLTLNRDFDLVSVLNRGKVAKQTNVKGAKLDPKEKARFKELTEKLSARDKQVAELEKEVSQKTANAVLKRSKGTKKFAKMSRVERDAALESTVEKAKKLISEGCIISG